MMEKLREMFEQGYRFVESSYYGESEVEDFEEVEDAVQEAEDEEYCHFFYEVDEEAHEIRFEVVDDE